MKSLFQAVIHDLRRYQGLVLLLCATAVAPKVAQAIESPWPREPWQGDMTGLYRYVPMQDNDTWTTRAQETSGLILQAAEDRYQDRVSGQYHWKGSPADSPDWRGVRRDTWYFLGYQFVAIGVIYTLPEDISGWSQEQKEDFSIEKWRDNVSDPHRDEDTWWMNYILHPYWGAAYYIRAQERGLNRGQSFLYSMLLSTLFEFGAEAMFEQPSYQDLIVTPVVGSLVGEYLFTPIRQSIRAQPGELSRTDKSILFLTDPLGVLNAHMDRILGVKTDVNMQFGPMVSYERRSVSESAQYRHHGEPTPVRGWGLQLRMSWL
jgi:hypothetical protein